MNADEWARLYRDALPEHLRPLRGSERLLMAAFDAVHHGWAPRTLAAMVARNNYTGAKNPPAVALSRLEDLAAAPQQGGAPGRGPRRNNGCIVCPTWHVYCPAPLTNADLIPDQWTRERFQLLMHELSRIPAADMSEDERENAMRVLIADQRSRPT